MRREEAIRLLALCAQCEMALVRRDAVVVALLAQASRAAPEGIAATALAHAANMARASDLLGEAGDARAARKAVQALTRIATQEAQAAALSEQDPRQTDA
jgi:hypothetical protein